jgi:hypothetical protein
MCCVEYVAASMGEDRGWMYTGWKKGGSHTKEWFEKTQWFVDHAYEKSTHGLIKCPCNKCENILQGGDRFVLAHQVEQVYYSTYPCPKLNAWWVVYKTNPRERLFEHIDEVFQEEELPTSFDVDPAPALGSLRGDPNDITLPQKRKQHPKQTWRPCSRRKQIDPDSGDT